MIKAWLENANMSRLGLKTLSGKPDKAKAKEALC